MNWIIKMLGGMTKQDVENLISQKDNEYCNGDDGYFGPKKYKSLFDMGINPRCGKPLSQCLEGFAHAHGELEER